jgi:hypothetical protein
MAMQDRDGDRERRSPYLPTGYRLDERAEREFVILRRPGGSEVAVYSATGADPKGMEERAWEDFRRRGSRREARIRLACCPPRPQRGAGQAARRVRAGEGSEVGGMKLRG